MKKTMVNKIVKIDKAKLSKKTMDHLIKLGCESIIPKINEIRNNKYSDFFHKANSAALQPSFWINCEEKRNKFLLWLIEARLTKDFKYYAFDSGHIGYIKKLINSINLKEIKNEALTMFANFKYTHRRIVKFVSKL